ncbi:MAG: transcription termination factor Rho, partial [Clostridia bacterium]|nr:transcription termination factor Rho [Clostridia bacterium]
MIKLRKVYAEELEREHLSVLREIGRFIGVKSPASKKKEELVDEILDIQSGRAKPFTHGKSGAPIKLKVDISKYLVDNDDFEYPPSTVDTKIEFSDVDCSFEVEGVLELHSDGYGFLRTGNYEASKRDIFVSGPNIKKHRLRRGDKVRGRAKIVREGESAALQQVLEINGMSPEQYARRVEFDDLTPCYPDKRIKLETDGQENDLAIRCVDLFAPLGMGQRGLIVPPPKTGKTTLLKKIAQAIERN